MLGCTRSSLNVIAAEKGVVVGRLIFSDNGDMIDCTKMGMGGKAIPPNIDRRYAERCIVYSVGRKRCSLY